MDRKVKLIPAFLFLLVILDRPRPASEPGSPRGFIREGDVVEHVGFPVGARFDVADGIGALRFGVSTSDGTLQCYDVGTNTWVLRDLYSRLSRLAAGNGRRLLAAQEPLPVTIVGLFDAKANAVLLCWVWVPRVDGNGEIQVEVGDFFDPNRNDRILDRRDLFPLPEQVPRAEPVSCEPPTVVVNVVVNVVVEVEDNDPLYPYFTPPPPPPPPPTPTPTPWVPPCTPTPEPPVSAISFPTKKPPTGRAERWGQANQASEQFNHPGLSQDVMDMLNPSRQGDND